MQVRASASKVQEPHKPAVAVIFLHQCGVWPKHQLYLAGAPVHHRVPASVLNGVVHVQPAVITHLGAFNTWPRLLQKVR